MDHADVTAVEAFRWSDAVGLLGVACVVGAYVLIQTRRWTAADWRYSAVNAMGAILLLISLMVTFNLASVVIEVVWLSISVYGLWRALRRDRA
ncbi:MAG: hypothetical protein ACFB2Z_11720 [Maricaulaceae bacterium]